MECPRESAAFSRRMDPPHGRKGTMIPHPRVSMGDRLFGRMVHTITDTRHERFQFCLLQSQEKAQVNVRFQDVLKNLNEFFLAHGCATLHRRFPLPPGPMPYVMDGTRSEARITALRGATSVRLEGRGTNIWKDFFILNPFDQVNSFGRDGSFRRVVFTGDPTCRVEFIP